MEKYGYLLSLVSAVVFSFSISALAMPLEAHVNPNPNPNPNILVPVANDDPRVSPQFTALGPMYEAASLIWSWVAPNKMSHKDAVNYCQSLGGGSRLPTEEEFEALLRVMTPGGTYNPDLFPGMRHRAFWSSSAHSNDAAFAFVFFAGYVGRLSSRHRYNGGSVRCVRGA
jgi:hypothetical protein